MQKYPSLDCDFCQFANRGFQKPTRFFGSSHLLSLSPKVCDGKTCPSLESDGDPSLKSRRRHRERLGGRGGNAKKALTYPIPYALVEYVTGLTGGHPVVENVSVGQMENTPSGKVQGVHGQPQQVYPHRWVRHYEEVKVMKLKGLCMMADHLTKNPEKGVEIKSEVLHSQEELDLVNEFRTRLLKEFEGTSLSGKYPRDPL